MDMAVVELMLEAALENQALNRPRKRGNSNSKQNDEWSLNRRYLQLEGLQTLSDTVSTGLAAVAR